MFSVWSFFSIFVLKRNKMDQDIPSIKSEVQDDFKPSIEMKAMANFESTVKVEKTDQDDFDEGMKLWNESLRRGLEVLDGIQFVDRIFPLVDFGVPHGMFQPPDCPVLFKTPFLI